MGTPASTSRNARLDVRLPREHKRMIEQAAAVTGQSLSDFAVSNLVRAALQTLDDAAVTRLSRRGRDAFLGLLQADAEPNKALNSAAKRYKKRRA